MRSRSAALTRPAAMAAPIAQTKAAGGSARFFSRHWPFLTRPSRVSNPDHEAPNPVTFPLTTATRSLRPLAVSSAKRQSAGAAAAIAGS